MLNGIRQGFGFMRYGTGGESRGDWKSGNRDGPGFMTWSNGDSYDGSWV